MKQLLCEICGSTNLIKQDGMFVCQSCGVKYSVEEIKQMIEDESLEKEETIKYERTDELKNLYEIARRAKNNNNSEYAQKYYDLIMVKDPLSWEAAFYTVYYQSMNCKIAEICSAAVRLSNCEDTVLKLIKDNVKEPEEVKKAVDEVAAKLIEISTMLFNAAKNHYDGISYEIRNNYTQEFLNNCCAARDVLYIYGNSVIHFFGDEFANGIAVPCWKTGISFHKAVFTFFADKEANKKVIEEYGNKIKKYDSSYVLPEVKTTGCYVATCVYGSYDCPEVWTLRRYRDNTLGSTWYGRAFIHTYYAISPTLVKWFGHTKWFKKMWKGKLDRMVGKLQAKGVESTPYEDKNW